MGSRKLPILFHLLFVSLTAAAAQPNFLYYKCTDTYGNYTSNSTYRENLNTLLSNITSDTRIRYGFYNFSSGQGSDEVNGIGLCRGDATFSTCHTCLNDSSYTLRELCHYQREAIGWYDNCTLRYSNRSIFGVREDGPSYFMWNPNNASDVDQLDKRLGSLLKNLEENASTGDSERKYATGSANITDFETTNAFVQCTPDLSQLDCFNCIDDSINKIPHYCAGKSGCRVLKPSCTLRYEFYRFYTPEADTSPSPSPPPSSPPNTTTTAKFTGKGSNTAKIAIIVATTTVVFVAVFALIIYCVRRRKNTSKKLKNEDEFERVDSLEYDCSTIRAATGNFSEEKKLGCGGFGTVYQGTLSNGQEIAVKRLDINSRQGEVEFKNEVLLVAKLQHRNLVRLLGFCLEGEERLLIYEFVPNRSLDYILFDSERRVLLDWEKRYKIISGVVRGLVYLHEDSRLRIIHRDLKASNILLDSEMSAKIADIGMAKLFQMDQTQANTSRIAGTYGYMAPEYALRGVFSVKSDVYSFGVLVLEIICGQRNSDASRIGENVEDLITRVWRNWTEETVISIVDPTILADSRTEIIRCLHIGLLCVQESVTDRPTMSSVALMLGSYSVSLPIPAKPAYLSYASDRSSVEDRTLTQQTVSKLSLTEELGPR